MSIQSPLQPEEPRAEPEIIPPGRARERGSAEWVFRDQHGTHRVFVTRLGPFSLIAMLLLVGLVAAVVLALLLGAVLIWIPVAVLLIVVAIVSSRWRQRFGRLR